MAARPRRPPDASGYSHGSYDNLGSAILDNSDRSFFEPRQPDSDENPPGPAKVLRDCRIPELRDQRALSIQHISGILKDVGIDLSVLPSPMSVLRGPDVNATRRPAHLMADVVRPDEAEMSDVRMLDLTPRQQSVSRQERNR